MSYATFARKESDSSAPWSRAASSPVSGGLRIGEPGDTYEQEADRVADEIMASGAVKRHWSLASPNSGGSLRRKCSCGASGGSGAECEECKREKEDKTLQRKAVGPAESGLAPPIVHEVLRSPGHPLDVATRAFMERRFGYDFSQIRVHADAHAARSARGLNALAYTGGRDIVFGAGQYSPSAVNGRKLLAHELAHVVQQGCGCSPGIKLKLSAEKLQEKEAEAAGASLDSPRASHPVLLSRSPILVQRACPPAPTGIAASKPSPYPCEHRGTEAVAGEVFYFCLDATKLLAEEVSHFNTFAENAKKATQIDIHGNASTEGPGEYNRNLACMRAMTFAAKLRDVGVTTPMRLYSHGETGAYGPSQTNRNVIVQLTVPASDGPLPKPAPLAEAISLAEADCKDITVLHAAHKSRTIGLFLKIYECLTCDFVGALRSGYFEDPLWLAKVNHFAIQRLKAAFSSPTADYQKAFISCNLLDRCFSPGGRSLGEVYSCQSITSSGTGILLYVQTCTEDVGGVHLSVDLRDALKSMGCASAMNKRDYAKVIPLFKRCNEAILSGELHVIGGGIARRVAIPRITEQRDKAWTDAGCPAGGI